MCSSAKHRWPHWERERPLPLTSSSCWISVFTTAPFPKPMETVKTHWRQIFPVSHSPEWFLKLGFTYPRQAMADTSILIRWYSAFKAAACKRWQAAAQAFAAGVAVVEATPGRVGSVRDLADINGQIQADSWKWVQRFGLCRGAWSTRGRVNGSDAWPGDVLSQLPPPHAATVRLGPLPCFIAPLKHDSKLEPKD